MKDELINAYYEQDHKLHAVSVPISYISGARFECLDRRLINGLINTNDVEGAFERVKYEKNYRFHITATAPFIVDDDNNETDRELMVDKNTFFKVLKQIYQDDINFEKYVSDLYQMQKEQNKNAK